MTYTYNEMLFSSKNKCNNESWQFNAKWNKQDTKGQILYDSTYMRYLEEANSYRQKYDRGYQGLGERENEKLLFNGYRVSIWDDEKLWKLIVMVISQNRECTKCYWVVHLKMVKIVNLMYISLQLKKFKSTLKILLYFFDS